MGNQNSTPPLVPHAHFPHALSSRYTRTHTVILRLEPCFWSHTHPEPLELRDVTTNLTMFRIPTMSPHQSTPFKRLLDMYNAPVATVMTQTTSGAVTTTTTIVPASTTSQRPCTIDIRLTEGTTHVAVRATWGDNSHTITCEGLWSHPHNVCFWFEPPAFTSVQTQRTSPQKKPTSATHRTPVARIRSDTTSSYLLEIAPGVDIALLLLLCAAIDEAVASHPITRQLSFHTSATAKRRTSRMEIAQPSMRLSDAVPVPV